MVKYSKEALTEALRGVDSGTPAATAKKLENIHENAERGLLQF